MQTLINQITNLRQTRASLSEKYQKGIITSDELHLLDYRKSVLKYKLKYQNNHGGIIEIPLEIAR